VRDVKGILDFLSYDEIRVDGGEWRPLAEANGRFGTTDETDILDVDREEGLRLRDRETGNPIAIARKTDSA
jgi:hypothetical protein